MKMANDDNDNIKKATGFTYHCDDEVKNTKYRLSDFKNDVVRI